jgi:hypothetical protein
MNEYIEKIPPVKCFVDIIRYKWKQNDHLQAEYLFSATIFLQHPRQAEDLSGVQIFLSLLQQMGLGGIASSGGIFFSPSCKMVVKYRKTW